MDENITHVKIETKIYLNASNRMYLSVVRQDVSDKLIYVYTLGCPAAKNDSFFIQPNTDVATFNNRNKADLYVGTIHQIMRIQSTWPLYQYLYKGLKEEIVAFDKTIKSLHNTQKVK